MQEPCTFRGKVFVAGVCRNFGHDFIVEFSRDGRFPAVPRMAQPAIWSCNRHLPKIPPVADLSDRRKNSGKDGHFAP